MIRRYSIYLIDHLNSESHGVVYSEPPRCIFPEHVIGKFCAIILTLWGLQKGSGDCENDGADPTTRFAPSCAIIFVSPQRVWGREAVFRSGVFRGGANPNWLRNRRFQSLI